MAFSVLLGRTKILTPVLRQQLVRIATQSCLGLRPNISSASIALHKAFDTTPVNIHNPIRSLNMTAVKCKARTEMPHDEHPHDHAKLWVVEKGVTVALTIIVPMALVFPNKILDAIMATLICAHSFWGLEAIAVDYVRASVVGPILPKIAIGLVYFVTIATLGGLFYIISHDIGVANTIRSLWSVKSDQNA